MAIKILEAFEKEPPELDFIWPGFLSGTVGALVAPGATGKSFWALQAAISVACSVPGGDLAAINPLKHGRVTYLAGEDPEPAIVRRLHAIGGHLKDDARKATAENMHIQSVMGSNFNVMDNKTMDNLVKHTCDTEARLIIFDTLSRIHQLDENSNGDMARLVNRLEYLASETGASVLYLHHISKGSARDGQGDQQQAARGASALVDNARWCGFVAKMTEQESEKLSDRPGDRTPIGNDRRGFYVRFGVSKQNYDATPHDQWYERREGGVLVPVQLVEAQRGRSGKKTGGEFND